MEKSVYSAPPVIESPQSLFGIVKLRYAIAALLTFIVIACWLSVPFLSPIPRSTEGDFVEANMPSTLFTLEDGDSAAFVDTNISPSLVPLEDGDSAALVDTNTSPLSPGAKDSDPLLIEPGRVSQSLSIDAILYRIFFLGVICIGIWKICLYQNPRTGEYIPAIILNYVMFLRRTKVMQKGVLPPVPADNTRSAVVVEPVTEKTVTQSSNYEQVNRVGEQKIEKTNISRKPRKFYTRRKSVASAAHQIPYNIFNKIILFLIDLRIFYEAIKTTSTILRKKNYQANSSFDFFVQVISLFRGYVFFALCQSKYKRYCYSSSDRILYSKLEDFIKRTSRNFLERKL